jgi:uncharacterized protein involved in outer membrane biogenesis
MSRPPTLLIRILAALALLVGAVLVLEWLEWPFLRGPLEQRLSTRLQREVVLGEHFGVRLFGSVRAHADTLRIGARAGDPALLDEANRPRDLMRAQEVRLELSHASVRRILRGERGEPLQLRVLEVGALELNLVRDAEGRANWQLGPPQPERDARPRLPRIEQFVVRNGSARYDDRINDLRLDATLRTREGSAAGAQGGLEIEAHGQRGKLPVQGRLVASGLLPLAASDGSTAVPFKLSLKSGDSALELDGSGRDLLHLNGVDAAFRVTGPSLAAMGDVVGVTVPSTAPFAMHGQVRRAGPVWDVAMAAFSTGSTRLNGQFRYDNRPEVPQLTGSLRGTRLALHDLAPALGARPRAAGAPPPKRPAGRVLPQREFDLPKLQRMNADVQVELDTLDLDSEQIADITPMHAKVRLHEGTLAVADLDARTSGGRLRGTIELDARTAARPLWSADLRWNGVRLERFVKARNRQAKVAPGAPRPGYVSGILNGSAKLQGRGRSTAEMLASLDGALQMWVADGQISHILVEVSGIDLAESLGLLVSGDAPLPVRCAAVRFALKDGVARTEAGVVDTADTTVLVTGSVSLAEERLDLQLRARPKDMSLVALRSPVHVEGPFAKPDVRIDKGRIGLRLAAAAALAAVTPVASLLALIDFGESEQAGICRETIETLKSGAPAKQPAPKKQP